MTKHSPGAPKPKIHWEAIANKNSRNIWEATRHSRALLHHPWLRVPCPPPDSWGGKWKQEEKEGSRGWQ